MNKTYISNDQSQKTWYLVNAKDIPLGRLSTLVSKILIEKDQCTYTPYSIKTSYVIIINSAHIKISGQKKHQKFYKKHSGKPGSLKIESFVQLQSRLPNKILEKAIRGMLPKNRLGYKLFNKLKIYSGPKHPHNAQNPQKITTYYKT